MKSPVLFLVMRAAVLSLGVYLIALATVTGSIRRGIVGAAVLGLFVATGARRITAEEIARVEKLRGRGVR